MFIPPKKIKVYIKTIFFVSGGKQDLNTLRDMEEIFKSLRLCLSSGVNAI